MAGLSGIDIALLAIGGFIAIVALVRLMNNRRDQILDELSEQAKRPKKKSAAAKPAASQPAAIPK